MKRLEKPFVLLSCICVLFILLITLQATAQDTRDAKQKKIAGTWDVSYKDAVLGPVEGTAVISNDEKSAKVTLIHPRTKEKYELTSTEIRRDDDSVTIILKGKSPSSDPVTDSLKEGLPKLEVAEKADKADVKVGDFSSEIPVRPLGIADLDRVEIRFKLKPDGELSGRWSYRADPRTQRDRIGLGRVGEYAAPKPDGELIGRQEGVENWIRQSPEIVAVVVLTDQTSYYNGLPNFPYPFNPGAAPNSDRRTLFICGRGLPHNYDEKIRYASDDRTLDYSTVALDSEKNKDPDTQNQFRRGWAQVLRPLDADTREIVSKLDGMIVRVDLRKGVLPGLKEFRVNDLSGSWILHFGDDRASISFAREITADQSDQTNSLLLPERFFIEVRTEVPLPLNEIPLVVEVNDAEVDWKGSPSIIASHVKDEETGETVEISNDTRPHRLAKLKNGVYHTSYIELIEAGRPAPTPEPGVFYLPVKPGDTIRARIRDPNLLNASPPLAQATVLRTPAQLGETWKEALERAARADGIEVTDWSTLSGQEAAEKANIIFTAGEKRRIKITVGEHAALLLLRDAFVKSIEEAAKDLPDIKDDLTLRGFRQAIERDVWNTRSPWHYVEVSGTGIRNVPLYNAFSERYMTEEFGDQSVEANRDAAEKWSLNAVREGLNKYKQTVQEAIEKAKPANLPDSDVEGLIKLIGRGYEPLLPEVLPRMMRLSETGTPPRQLWIPDLNGRYSLRELHTVVEAISAQEEYSKLDTQATLLALTLVSSPFMLGENLVCAAVLWGTEAVNTGVAIADVAEFIQQRKDIKFALGASLVLGTDRLSEAMLNKSEWFQLVASVGPAALGLPAATINLVPRLSIAIAHARTILNLYKIESRGLEAFKKLSDAEKIGVVAAMAETKLLNEIDKDVLTSAQKRALRAAERLESEIRAQTSTAKLEPQPSKATTKALGEPGKPVGVEPTEKVTRDPIESEPAGDTESYKSQDIPNKPNATEPPLPVSESPWTTVDRAGRTRVLKLGKQLGKGTYATVFELIDSGIKGCESGCVVKVFLPAYDELFQTGREVVNNIEKGSRLLAEAKDGKAAILQLENVEFVPNAERPYIIQKKIDPQNMTLFENKEIVEVPDPTSPGGIRKESRLPRKTQAAFVKDKGLQKAVAKLFYNLKENGLVWEDCHLGNMFFVKDARGEWVAGILDQDRIIRFSERQSDNMSLFMGITEVSSDNKLRIRSLSGSKMLDPSKAYDLVLKQKGPFYPSAEFFMEKMFEYKAYVIYDPDTKTFHQILIEPDVIREYFPKLDSDAVPLDLTVPHWKRISRLTRPLWVEDLALAA